jgi:hypothetical protein
LEKTLLELLVKMEVIHPAFIGSVTLHIGQGAISDIDRYEKCLLRSRRSGNRLPRLSK